MIIVSDSHAGEGDRDCEELVSEHVDSGNAGKVCDGVELALKC